jgi:hypothetical protein
VGAFYLVGAEVTGAAVITILEGPAVGTTVILSKHYDSYKRSGKHLLQICPMPKHTECNNNIVAIIGFIITNKMVSSIQTTVLYTSLASKLNPFLVKDCDHLLQEVPICLFPLF